MPCKRLIALLVMFGLWICLQAAPAAAQPAPVVERLTIIEHGTYKARLIDRVPRPGDPSGYANSLEGHQLIETTTEVCARLGVRFGITLRLDGTPTGSAVMLEIVNNYPPDGIVNDKGQKFFKTRFPWTARFGEPTAIVFTFDETWEMVHGPWKFDIEYNGRRIGQQAFTVMTTCETS